MNPFDPRYLQIRLEAIKLAQGSLQQIMTLSAGALALYFGFISKANFTEGIRYPGVIVVVAWAISLCTAAIAHLLHVGLFKSLCNMATAVEDVIALQTLPREIEDQLTTAVDRNKVVDEGLKKLASEKARFERESQAFSKVFFASQKRATQLTALSLASFVVGFVVLAEAYITWSLRT